MDPKIRKVMKAKQGKIATGSGDIVDSEGYEGQVQVRDTKDGPMLFAKLKGKWIQSPLIQGDNFFIPKAHTAKVVLPPSNNNAFYIVPNFIPIPDILHISVVAITRSTSTLYTQMPPTDQILSGAAGWWLGVVGETRKIYITQVFGSTWQNAEARLTIFYK